MLFENKKFKVRFWLPFLFNIILVILASFFVTAHQYKFRYMLLSSVSLMDKWNKYYLFSGAVCSLAELILFIYYIIMILICIIDLAKLKPITDDKKILVIRDRIILLESVISILSIIVIFFVRIIMIQV